MNVKLSEILDMKEPLGRLSNEKLPLKVAFKLSKVIKEIDQNLTDIHNQREKLFKELAVEEEGQLSIPPESVDEFNSQWGELLGVEIDLSLDVLSFDDLPDVQLTTQDMLKLSVIFEE